MENTEGSTLDSIDSLEEVQSTALNTLGEMLLSFIEHLPFLAGAMLTLLLTWGLARLVTAFGTRLLQSWSKRDSVKELIVRLLSIIVWVMGLLLTAIVLFPGLTPSKALGGLGLVSIAVGLAFKDIFENFFAGILILWRFPFERGDYIECEGLVGKVERILVRMSYIRETNGELTVVPNSFLFKNPVTILTSEPSRRVMLTTGVAYDVDVGEAVEVITQAVNACETLTRDKPVQVFPKAFGSSSIDIEIAWWTESTPLGVRRSTGEVVTAVKSALDKAGIEIPFPYRTLTFKESLPIRQEASAGNE
ncbi:mechanosensitive ion channel family protein [Granulosicoccus sp. 3-233]|uniref:mechanosensitive ion channel family protein n=1 Tax=Granulosicoccus sp. 3-233 TaxID=3417969 RepID=UPI003D3574E5